MSAAAELPWYYEALLRKLRRRYGVELREVLAAMMGER